MPLLQLLAGEDRPVSVYSVNEIATEKIVALQDRAGNEPRDLYDLWFLTSHAGVDIGHLIGAIKEKLRFREKDIAGVEDRIRKRSSPDGTMERPSRASDGSITAV